MRRCGGQAGRWAPGSWKTWPLSVASAPVFTPSPPARGWPVSLAGATRRAPHLGRFTPHPLPQSGARPPPFARPQGCGRGRYESCRPPSGSEQGSAVLWPTTPTRKQGTLVQRWALACGGLPLEPEAGGGGAGSCSRHQLGTLPGGPWDGQVDWLQGNRGASVCFWGLSERAPPDGSPVYMSAQAGFPSSWYFCCRFSALRGAGSRD